VRAALGHDHAPLVQGGQVDARAPQDAGGVSGAPEQGMPALGAFHVEQFRVYSLGHVPTLAPALLEFKEGARGSLLR